MMEDGDSREMDAIAAVFSLTTAIAFGLVFASMGLEFLGFDGARMVLRMGIYLMWGIIAVAVGAGVIGMIAMSVSCLWGLWKNDLWRKDR